MIKHFSHKIVYRLHKAIPVDFSCTMIIAARTAEEAIGIGDRTFAKKHGGCIVMSSTTFELTNEELVIELKGE